MSCDINKFTVSKGSDNTFVFTIKQDNSTLPLVIDFSDTFFATLVNLETDTPYTEVVDVPLTIEDENNGKVSLTINAADTADLISDKAGKVDRYYLRPTYKLVLTCNTVNNGNFIAKVQEVYVD